MKVTRGILTISSLSSTDSGVFICEAKTPYYTIEARTDLLITNRKLQLVNTTHQYISQLVRELWLVKLASRIRLYGPLKLESFLDPKMFRDLSPSVIEFLANNSKSVKLSFTSKIEN